MFILSLSGQEGSGAYACKDDQGNQALYLFQQEDDATRYMGLLEADDSAPLSVVEIDDQLAFETCKNHNYRYVIITPDDIVIPPTDYDYIQDDTVA
tara:strand:+ start:675 stop:962 length:288 start_codon:yes stop_codon:yes gene_type:complete